MIREARRLAFGRGPSEPQPRDPDCESTLIPAAEAEGLRARRSMTDPSKAPGSNYDRPSPVSQGSPSEDRGLGDMLSREIPRALPIGLAALAARLAEALRSREA